MTTTHTTAATAWTGMLPVDDTQLYVSDSGGSARPVLYLNGCFGDLNHWRKVVADLGDDFRHVRFDERARGKSGTSSDYSYAGCLRDVGAVIQARRLERPILLGWSYGAALAASWAADHSDELTGLVLVDGALPYGLTGPEGRATLRRLFQRIGWLLPLAARLGLAAQMSWQQHAEVNIEGNEILAGFAPTLEAITCPARYVLGSGGNLGADAAIMADVRASLRPVLERNHHLRVSSQVASNHAKIVSREAAAIARAVREVAALEGRN